MILPQNVVPIVSAAVDADAAAVIDAVTAKLSMQDLIDLNDRSVTEQLTSANDAIKKASGITPTFYRPTFGAVNPKVREISKQQGQAMIMWDVDTQDWSNKDVKLVIFDKSGTTVIKLLFKNNVFNLFKLMS